jgi:MFS family permease
MAFSWVSLVHVRHCCDSKADINDRFLLGGSAVVLPFGKVFGLFNTKWLFNGSIILFNVGSAICGAAPDMNALIVGRVLAGIGGNGMYLGVQTLLSVNTTPKERPGYLSFV